MVKTKDILREVEKYLNEMGYADEIDIVRGSITVNFQIDKNRLTVSIKDRELSEIK